MKNIQNEKKRAESTRIEKGLKCFSREFKKARVERLRRLKNRDGVTPNFKAKLWGVRLLDQISDGKGINLPDGDRGENTENSRGEMKTESDVPPLQKQDGRVITAS